MSESICNFVPSKPYGAVRTVHFVYETEHHTLHQPFFRPFYCLYLVTSGTAEILCGTERMQVGRGSLYFFFPSCVYTVKASEDFRYMYISFTGEGAPLCLRQLHLDTPGTVYRGQTELTDFWFSAILRANEDNSMVLAEGVLLYTLAALIPVSTSAGERSGEALCHLIADYIGNHFTEADLSLGEIARVFNYTEKYISVLFKRHMGVGFRSYLASLRLTYANRLLSGGGVTVSEVAAAVGYRDALYFSKAFKAQYGVSPGACIPR
ncbi:MAG: AraC family transcriptional regulator [Clostridia bacterium]|nr:AraC family transcriptional regulator [Clostridia bacterium]